MEYLFNKKIWRDGKSVYTLPYPEDANFRTHFFLRGFRGVLHSRKRGFQRSEVMKISTLTVINTMLITILNT